MECVCAGSGYCQACEGEGCEACGESGECRVHQAWQLPRSRHFQPRLEALAGSRTNAPMPGEVRNQRLAAPRYADARFDGVLWLKYPDLALADAWQVDLGDGRRWDLPRGRRLLEALALARVESGERWRLVATWDQRLRDGEGAHRWRVERARAEASDRPGRRRRARTPAGRR